MYRWVYATTQLGQILMTIGLVFVMIASVNLVFGSSTYSLTVPGWLQGTGSNRRSRFHGIALSSFCLASASEAVCGRC